MNTSTGKRPSMSTSRSLSGGGRNCGFERDVLRRGNGALAVGVLLAGDRMGAGWWLGSKL